MFGDSSPATCYRKTLTLFNLGRIVRIPSILNGFGEGNQYHNTVRKR